MKQTGTHVEIGHLQEISLALPSVCRDAPFTSGPQQIVVFFWQTTLYRSRIDFSEQWTHLAAFHHQVFSCTAPILRIICNHVASAREAFTIEMHQFIDGFLPQQGLKLSALLPTSKNCSVRKIAGLKEFFGATQLSMIRFAVILEFLTEGAYRLAKDKIIVQYSDGGICAMPVFGALCAAEDFTFRWAIRKRDITVTFRDRTGSAFLRELKTTRDAQYHGRHRGYYWLEFNSITIARAYYNDEHNPLVSYFVQWCDKKQGIKEQTSHVGRGGYAYGEDCSDDDDGEDDTDDEAESTGAEEEEGEEEEEEGEEDEEDTTGMGFPTSIPGLRTWLQTYKARNTA